jgi:hypothetical protein
MPINCETALQSVRLTGAAQNKKADRRDLPARVLRRGAFVPGIGMNDVAVFVGPGDFFVAQFDLLKVVMLLEGGSLMSCIFGSLSPA